MGKVFIKKQNGNQFILKEVRKFPYLKKNLISIEKLGGEGCITTFLDKVYKVTKGVLVIKNVEKVGTLYLAYGISYYVNYLTSTRAYTTLLHHRLIHVSEKGMQILHSRDLLLGLKDVNFEFCENCVYIKQKRVKFIRFGMENKRKQLQLVHTDVWGPSQVSCLGGSHQCVTFIDGTTRKTCIYCIQNKYDAFDTLKKWKDLVENETGKKLKCRISDKEGKYYNKEFDN